MLTEEEVIMLDLTLEVMLCRPRKEYCACVQFEDASLLTLQVSLNEKKEYTGQRFR